jgi:hypothetical protein
MPRLALTQHLHRYVQWQNSELPGQTVAQVLEAGFARCPALKPYVVDEHGRLRKHVMVFVSGQPISDTVTFSDPVGQADEVFIMQALSGG